MSTPPRYHVVFAGTLEPGHEPDDVRQKLIDRFGSPAKVNALFVGGRVLVKRCVNQADARRYQRAFAAAGARCDLVEATPEADVEGSKRTLAYGSPAPSPRHPTPRYGSPVFADGEGELDEAPENAASFAPILSGVAGSPYESLPTGAHLSLPAADAPFPHAAAPHPAARIAARADADERQSLGRAVFDPLDPSAPAQNGSQLDDPLRIEVDETATAGHDRGRPRAAEPQGRSALAAHALPTCPSSEATAGRLKSEDLALRAVVERSTFGLTVTAAALLLGAALMLCGTLGSLITLNLPAVAAGAGATLFTYLCGQRLWSAAGALQGPVLGDTSSAIVRSLEEQAAYFRLAAILNAIWVGLAVVGLIASLVLATLARADEAPVRPPQLDPRPAAVLEQAPASHLDVISR